MSLRQGKVVCVVCVCVFFPLQTNLHFSIGKKILLILLLGTLLCLGKSQKIKLNFFVKKRFEKKNSVIISGDSVIIMIKVSARGSADN